MNIKEQRIKWTARLRAFNAKSDFNRTFSTLVTGSLMLICALILGVTIRGPHIREVLFSPELSTQVSGQWLILHTNQPLPAVHSNHIAVSPAVPINTLSSGSEIALQLERRLPYDTRYTVQVKMAPIKLTYHFTTPDGTCYYLLSPGTIKEHTVGQKIDRTVYQAPFINSFALTGDYLAVVVQNGATEQLIIVNTKTHKSNQVKLPEAGTISKVASSPDGQDFSYTFTSGTTTQKPYYNSTLFSVNAVTLRSSPVYGFSHHLIRTTDWIYSPDGSVIVAQDFSSVLMAVYLNNQTPPLPLGAYSLISGFSYDGSQIFVGNQQQEMQVINVSTRTVTSLNQTPLGPDSSIQLLDPLVNSAGYIVQVQKPILNSASVGQYIVLVQGTHQRILYASADGADAISGVTISPNDEYASIGVTPTSYTRASSGTPASTLIVDVASGKVVDKVPSLEQVLWQ